MTALITITADVPVAPSAACDAFDDPKALLQWNRASPDWHCLHAEVDLRVGGRRVATNDAAQRGEGAS
mgnify:CR=1 FL=1